MSQDNIDPRPVKCPTCKAEKKSNCISFRIVDGIPQQVKLEIRHSHDARFRKFRTSFKSQQANSGTTDSPSQ